MQKLQQKSSSIKVYIRIRPLVGQELNTKEVVEVLPDGKTINITSDSLSIMSVKFDEALPQQSTQKEVYSHFNEYISKIPEGYNLTVFAYGQTGSGKTYTMFGNDWQNMMTNNLGPKRHQNTFFQDIGADENFAGVIPRSIYHLFQQIDLHKEKNAHFQVYCSFLQIYNEKIYDLLQDFPRPKALNLHQSKLEGIFVEGLAEYNVSHYLDCLQLMKRGQKNRYIRQTSMNTKSSRSHTIFQILLESASPDQRGIFKKARLNLCDLAGSQKVNKSQQMSGQHFQELKNINQSLTTLGKVIASLSSSKSKGIPAFRQSKLTRLLQESLTGNTFTFIVGNISPSINNMDQTMNTLKFVQRARHITMKVKPMQFNGDNLQVVHRLQKEIQYLKELLNLKRKGLSADDVHNQLLHLQEQNEKLKKTSISFHDVQKLIQQNRKMKMQIYKLQTSVYPGSEDKSESRSQISIGSYKNTNKVSSSQDVTNYDRLITQNGFLIPQSSGGSTKRQQIQQSPQKYSPYQTKKSLVSAGKISVDSVYSMDRSHTGERDKEKNRILNKLEQLQRIQKFNEEKLMRDLEQLQKKNAQISKSYTSNTANQLRKKTNIKPSSPLNISTSKNEKKINYEDRIKQLQAKLFGK